MGNITIQTATVPEGTCPSWIIALWPQLVGLVTANLNGALNTFNYGSSTPAPADQDKPWLKLDTSGYPDGQYWVYKGGFWLKKHPMAPGLISLYAGDLATLDTFDGGEAAAVSLTTGPMWERYAEMDAKFPLGPGTLPSGAVKVIGDTGGEENHILTIPEMPIHHHGVKAQTRDTDGGTTAQRLAPDSTLANSYGDTFDTGGDQPHNTMPPYATVGFIRRTARTMYRA